MFKIPQKIKLTKKVLCNVAKPMDFDYPQQNLILANRMHAFMRDNDAIGLAAPQIGISRRVFVMQVGELAFNCFNPKILESSDELITFEEGCLSFPDEFLTITRPKTIKVQYQDHTGAEIIKVLKDIVSICFQHELDHLNGIVFHDRTTT